MQNITKTKHQSLLVIACLFCTYFIWGSTYLAIKFAIESFPPFIMVALRFTAAGAILYAVMRYLGSSCGRTRVAVRRMKNI